jgi:V-type H+-transporting ATPase subunit D
LLKHLACRLKKVQGKKKRDTAAAEIAKQVATDTAQDELPVGEDEWGGNLLSSKDDDVIF